ncbi:single-stranded DNA-binding protein [Propionibacterium sp.]|jgi:single-stranded DNA-binding protein|uniref:single-stranded DNA-binding protein n=1 Tax=Propionibacterium sp. TaxID=1977903 RepID=UPI0039ED9898|nr:single-stranded DNA-binding protein [Bifidobacteriaceae bacterium]
MAGIQTQQAVAGFVASDPQLAYTEKGDARLYFKLGVEHYRREEDQSFTKLETTYHDLVAFKTTAEQGYARLAKGDSIIANGRVREYSYERDGQRFAGEEFVATRLGHDLARTRYDVDRTLRQNAASQDGVARDAVSSHSSERPGPERRTPGIGL